MSSTNDLSRVAGRRIESVEASAISSGSLVALKLTLDDGSELHINAHLYGDDPAFEAEHVLRCDAVTPCPFCPSRTLAQCKAQGCTHLAGSGEPIPERGSAEWRNLFQSECPSAVEHCERCRMPLPTACLEAGCPHDDPRRACPRCGLVAGCACERGA